MSAEVCEAKKKEKETKSFILKFSSTIYYKKKTGKGGEGRKGEVGGGGEPQLSIKKKPSLVMNNSV